VRSVTDFRTRAHHYNLTVRQLHTYFVGRTPVLVHNCADLPPVGHLALGLNDKGQLTSFAASIGAKTYEDPELMDFYFDKSTGDTFAYLRWIMSRADRITFYQEGFDVEWATSPGMKPVEEQRYFTNYEYQQIMANPDTLGIKTYFEGNPLGYPPANPTEGLTG
jgi:hypothetical protein